MLECLLFAERACFLEEDIAVVSDILREAAGVDFKLVSGLKS